MSDYVVIYEAAEDRTVGAYLPDLPTILMSERDRDEVRDAVLQGLRLYRKKMERMGIAMPEHLMRHEVVSV